VTNSATRDNLFEGLLFSIRCHFSRNFQQVANHWADTIFLTALLSLVSCFLVVPSVGAQNASTFKGEITDEHLNCIQTPVKAVQGVTDKVSCVLYWAHFVQPPSKYVLYDAASKKTYQLSDQNLVQPYVGEMVEVTGKLDAATKTIDVTGIKVPDDNPKKS
jgi:hypothetical protein